MNPLLDKLQAALAYLQKELKELPTLAIVLGSGLNSLEEKLQDKQVIPYQSIPYCPKATAIGHKGELLVGKLKGRSVLMMNGRFHYYEGYSMDEVTFLIRVFALLGVEQLILTNAAGGCSLNFSAGDLMLIKDHINFFGTNPLIGQNIDLLGPRFPDMSEIYTLDYQRLAKEVAKKVGIKLQEGVYMGFSGPSYETPAEIRMAQTLGASAVGMSTIPEAIVANHAGMKVLGISCITNLAAGLKEHLSHDEVLATGKRVAEDFKVLIEGIVEDLPLC